MSIFFAIHRAPGLSNEEFAENGSEVLEGTHAQFVQVFANLDHGTIVSVYEADDRESLIKEFQRVGFPYDEIEEAQLVLDFEELQRLVSSNS